MMLVHGFSLYSIYLPIFSGMVPFASGALLYYVLKRWSLPGSWLKPWLLSGVLLWAALCIACHHKWINDQREGLFISLIPSMLILSGLLQLRPEHFSAKVRQWDKLLGMFSYPIFLVHWSAGIITAWVIPHNLSQRHGSLFLASLPVIHLLAWGICAGIKRPVERWRDRVRPPKTAVATG